MCKLHKITAVIMLLSILNWGFVSTVSAAVMATGHPAGVAHELMSNCANKSSEANLYQAGKQSNNHCPGEMADNSCEKNCLSCMSGIASIPLSGSNNAPFIQGSELVSASIDIYKNPTTVPHLRPPQVS